MRFGSGCQLTARFVYRKRSFDLRGLTCDDVGGSRIVVTQKISDQIDSYMQSGVVKQIYNNHALMMGGDEKDVQFWEVSQLYLLEVRGIAPACICDTCSWRCCLLSHGCRFSSSALGGAGLRSWGLGDGILNKWGWGVIFFNRSRWSKTVSEPLSTEFPVARDDYVLLSLFRITHSSPIPILPYISSPGDTLSRAWGNTA